MRRNPPVKLTSVRSGLGAPDSGTWRLELNDPALSAMTDFHERTMVVVDARLQIDAALDLMRHAGVRSAFVMDATGESVLGIVTAYDIMGEKPLRHLHALGGRHRSSGRRDVVVADIMDCVEDWNVIRLEDLDRATIGSVVETIHAVQRTHIAVIEQEPGEQPRLRGLFSLAKLLRLTESDRQESACA